jgi:hypothetical protein
MVERLRGYSFAIHSINSESESRTVSNKSALKARFMTFSGSLWQGAGIDRDGFSYSSTVNEYGAKAGACGPARGTCGNADQCEGTNDKHRDGVMEIHVDEPTKCAGLKVVRFIEDFGCEAHSSSTKPSAKTVTLAVQSRPKIPKIKRQRWAG